MSGFNVGDRVVALYDFTKEQPEDMNVWSGDSLIIVDNNVGEGWVSAENPSTRERGWVPAGYLQMSSKSSLKCRIFNIRPLVFSWSFG